MSENGQERRRGERRGRIRRVVDIFAAFSGQQQPDLGGDLDRRRTTRRAADQAERSAAASDAPNAIGAAPVPSSQPTVLVVDDVDMTRVGLAELLRLRGYNALQATNGADGIQKLREHPHVRTIILDLQMPGFDGFWFREQQLMEPALAAVPVIVFTGTRVTEQRARELQVANVLSKPISVDQLFDVVGRHCARSMRD